MSKETSILPIQPCYSLDDRTVAATVLHREPLVFFLSSCKKDLERSPMML